MAYIQAYGWNQSAEKGHADIGGVDEPIYSPPETSLALSYSTQLPTACPDTLGIKSVVGAPSILLWPKSTCAPFLLPQLNLEL